MLQVMSSNECTLENSDLDVANPNLIYNAPAIYTSYYSTQPIRPPSFSEEFDFSAITAGLVSHNENNTANNPNAIPFNLPPLALNLSPSIEAKASPAKKIKLEQQKVERLVEERDHLIVEISKLRSERDKLASSTKSSPDKDHLQLEVSVLKEELKTLRSQPSIPPTIWRVQCKLLANPSLIKFAEEKYGTNQLIPFLHDGKEQVAMLSKINSNTMVVIPVDVNHLFTISQEYPNPLTKICDACESLYKCLYRGYYYRSCKKKPNSRNYNARKKAVYSTTTSNLPLPCLPDDLSQEDELQ